MSRLVPLASLLSVVTAGVLWLAYLLTLIPWTPGVAAYFPGGWVL